MKTLARVCMGAFALLCVTAAVAVALPDPGQGYEGLAQRAQTRAIRFGDMGQVVADLQRALSTLGCDPGPLDGIFGPRTEAAVRAAQALVGVPVDGVVGRLTVKALWARLSGPVAPVAAKGAAGVRLLELDGPDLEGVGLGSGWAVGAVGDVPHGLSTAESATQFGLTFNGAPDPALVPVLLDALAWAGMQATFFTAGEVAPVRPELLAKIAAGGHEIASAGYASLDMSRVTPAMMRAQLLQTDRSIVDAVGRKPRFFRPPLGIVNAELATQAHEAGLRVVMWTNVGAKDPEGSDPSSLAARLSDSLFPGAILMIHQDRPSSVAAMASFLSEATAKGYHSVTLTELFEQQNCPRFDMEGLQVAQFGDRNCHK